MNGFKKITSLIIIFVLCLGAFNCSFSYAADGEVDEIRDALEILRVFEIIPDYYDYNTPFDKEVSRAEFVDAVANLINMGDYKGVAVHYYDVPKTHFAYNSICALTGMGILNGTGESLFEPDAPIEDAAAYKIVLGVMGYGDYAHHNGGYPSGYLSAAKRAEIFVDSSTANITHEEMLRIIYRALTAEILVPVIYSADGEYVVAEKSEDETIASLYYDAYEETGIVTGADCMSLSDKSLDEKEEVLIDDVLYKSEVDLSEYLGEEIEFFYREVSEDERVIFWARQTGGSNVLYVSADYDASFDENSFVFTYADGNENSKITLSRTLLMMYNGGVVDDKYGDILNLPRYNVKFIKNNGSYDTAIVTAYENYVADLIDRTNAVVYDKFNSTNALKLNESLYEYFSIKRVDGNEITVSDIKADDVLSVFMSKDGKRIEVVVETTTKAGVISEMRKNDRGYIITIDGNSYYMPADAYNGDFEVADNVKLYLDYTGYVAAAKLETGSSFAAYVIDFASEYVFNESIKLKMFRQDGAVAVYECVDKITVDGKSNCTVTDVKNALMADGAFKPQLILVKINTNGLITEIDTEFIDSGYETVENSLIPNLEYAERQYKIQGYFNFEAAINDNTIIFGVPGDDWVENAEPSAYRMIKKSELTDDSKHYVMSYNVGSRNGYEQYVVIKEQQIPEYGQDLPILVTGKGSAVNNDSDVVECIYGYQGNVQKTVLSNGNVSFADVKEGMLVRINFNREGYAVDKTILYDPENADKYYTTTAPFNHRYGIEVGFVNDVIEDVIKIGYKSGADINHVSNMYNSPAVLVYDSDDDRNPAYIGSFGDAKRYYNVGDDCSQVVLITRHCTPLLYVLYN